jgi:alanine dehydrogenase
VGFPGQRRRSDEMIVGILKEVKEGEHRVSMTPAGVEVMRLRGHGVLFQSGAGEASGFDDEMYARAGAEVLASPKEIFSRAQMILRVREPEAEEYDLIQEDQIWFSYLHLAASLERTHALIRRRSINIAYETVQKANGSLPLLTPMSEVAGRMAIQEGAKYLEMAQGGDGVLLGGVPGVDPGMVLIIGGGVVGMNAAKTACGLGARVYVLDTNLDRLRYLSDVMPSNCFVLASNPMTIRDLVTRADVVVGAVLVPGGRTPVVVTHEMLHTMKRGAVLVDVAIDQGGCFETSQETTHARPTYTVEGVVHYAVSNMPGALPRTSTLALTNATLPYALEIADKGWGRAMRDNPEIRSGANVVRGRITCMGVTQALGLDYTPIDELLG